MTAPSFPLTEEGVAAALAALGSSPAAVAQRLLEGGHRGVPDDCRACPVANYLRAAFPDALYLSVTETGVLVTVSLTARRLEVAMPEPVGEFIDRFDSDGYRELRDFPSAEPAGVS